jgi:hypothetical protein
MYEIFLWLSSTHSCTHEKDIDSHDYGIAAVLEVCSDGNKKYDFCSKIFCFLIRNFYDFIIISAARKVQNESSPKDVAIFMPVTS